MMRMMSLIRGNYFGYFLVVPSFHLFLSDSQHDFLFFISFDCMFPGRIVDFTLIFFFIFFRCAAILLFSWEVT